MEGSLKEQEMSLLCCLYNILFEVNINEVHLYIVTHGVPPDPEVPDQLLISGK